MNALKRQQKRPDVGAPVLSALRAQVRRSIPTECFAGCSVPANEPLGAMGKQESGHNQVRAHRCFTAHDVVAF